MRVPYRELLCLPFVAVGLALPSLVHGDLLGSEGIAHYYSQRSLLARQVRMGEIPSWNPYLVSGYPEIGDPDTNFFYPFNVPLLVALPAREAINVSIILHLVLAGSFMYLYLGSLSPSRPARFLGAMIYMLSGFTAGRILAGDIPRLEIYAWIPLLFYLVDEIVSRRQRMGASALGGLVLACQFFAGEQQTFIYSSLALIAYAILRLVQVRRSAHTTSTARAVIFLTLMFLLGGLYSTAQLLPSLESLELSNRAHPHAEFSLKGSIPFVGLVSLIAPRLFGDELHNRWGELLAPEFYLHASVLYVGFFTLVLILTAFTMQRNLWHVRFFGFFGMIALWLALGKFGYLYRVVLYIPILRNFRGSENINILLPLSASVLAAIGFDKLITAERSPEIWTRVLRFLWLVMGGEVLIVAGTLFLQGYKLDYDPHARTDLLHAGTESAIFVLIVFIISVALLRYRSQHPVPPPWFGGIVTAFIVIDLLYFGFPMVNAGTNVRSIAPSDAVTRYLVQDRSLYRVYGLGDRGMLFGVQEVSGGTGIGLLLDRYSEYTNFIQGYQLGNIDDRPAGPHGVIISRGFDSPLMGLLNVKYVVGGPELMNYPDLVQVAPGLPVYRNTMIYPRVLDSYSYEILHDKLTILRELSRSGYDPHRFIVLEKQPDMPPDSPSSGGRPAYPAELKVTTYSDKRVVIRGRFSRRGFLVLNDIYYPGWTAYLDGHLTKIYQANYLFRAVTVPAGAHIVSFVYRDRALELGATVSAAAMVAALIAWLVDRLSRRKGSGRKPRSSDTGPEGSTPQDASA